MPNENGQVPGSVTRTVNLRIPHDHSDEAGRSEPELVASSNVSEGVVILDDSGRRKAVRVGGSPARFEMTVMLVPGWESDAAWDVDQGSPQAIDDAIEAATDTAEEGTAWERKYITGWNTQENVGKSAVGRYWVLNEDGGFRADRFKRTSGPWSTDEAWHPYDFAVAGGVTDLKKRGASGWSCRRRRFLPPLAINGSVAEIQDRCDEVGFQIAISFHGDTGPWYYHQCSADVLAHRCGIFISENDLRTIQPADEGDNFVSAYIRGNLRVKVTAVIEGDDAVYGYDGPSSLCALPWTEYVDRRGKLGRDLRHAAKNDYYDTHKLKLPKDRDDTVQADALARRMLSEFEIRRACGQGSTPYLVQSRNDVPWDGFGVGDEVRHIITGDYRSTMSLVSGNSTDARSPRVHGVTYRWSRDPAETSTTIELEDGSISSEDVIGPLVQSELPGRAPKWTR